MASGYFADRSMPQLARVTNVDLKLQDMSWAGAAGALVSRPEDVNRWARALFQSDMLDDEQRAQLTTLVSMDTGETIGSTSVEHPHGFGLGVAGFTEPIGSGWGYEGETLGFRAVYVFLPDEDIVAAVAVNSNPGPEDRVTRTAFAVLEAALR
jgi:D-alanyl-D-alanine carboxypeptidase